MNTLTTTLKKTKFATFSALFLAGLMAGEASAAIVLARANVNPQGASTPLLLDLDSAAGLQSAFTFFMPSTGIARVILNAEASIAGVPTNYLDSTILIDNIACTPSNSDNALVSGTGGATQNDGWTSVVTQCFTTLTTGPHTVRVLVTPVPNPTAWRIDDTSLVIDTQ